MGLSVILYINAKIHSCDSLYKENSSKKYWNKSNSEMVSDLKSVYPTAWSKMLDCFEEVDLDCFDCKCDLESIKILAAGYVSYYDADKEFCSGKIIEYSRTRSFDFGSYFKFAREREMVPLMTEMSDCDGWYTGRFLLALVKKLRLTPDLTPSLEEYKELFDDLSDDTILNSCVLQHC